MKLLLLAGLLAVAFCHLDFSTDDNIGRKSVYRLESQLASGMPGSSDLHAIVRLSARAHYGWKSTSEVILRLTDFVAGRLNDQVEKVDQLVSMKSVDMQDLDSKVLEALKLPVSFKYIDGLISDIMFDHRETEWTMNYKRSVISMFQMDKEMVTIDRKIQEETRTVETTVEGECEVMYSATKELKNKKSSDDLFGVTKTIDFSKCQRSAHINYDYVEAEVCKDCWRLHGDEPQDHHVKNLHRSTMIDYVFSKKRIQKIDLLSVYVVPNVVRSTKSDLVSTVVIQMVHEKDVDMSDDQIEGPRHAMKSDLLYSSEKDRLIEQFEMYGDEAVAEKNLYAEMPRKMDESKALLEKLVQPREMKERGLSWMANVDYYSLVELFRTLTMKELNQLYDETYHMHGHLAHDIYVNLLASAGTYNTVHFLVEKTMANRIHIQLASQVLKTLNIRKPSKPMIEDLLRLCKESDMKVNAFAHQSCWLHTGAVINKWTKTNNMEDDKLQDAASEFFTVLARQFSSAKSTMEKVVALKAIGNAGLNWTMGETDLQQIIMDKKQEKIVRIQTIDALRLQRTTIPHKIHMMLLPVFQDSEEVPEIRMSAFSMIMHTLPEQKILDQIVKILANERSSHVASFVVSMIDSLSQSNHPCEKKLADDLKDMINIAHLNKDLRASTDMYYHIPMYSMKMNSGAFINFASVFSDDSPIVKEAMVALDTLFQGEWQKNLLQLGFAQENFEKVIEVVRDYINEKLRSVKWDEPMALRGERATMQTPRQMLKNIIKNLMIESRDNKQKSLAMLYLRWKNIDHAVFNFDFDFIEMASKSIDTFSSSSLMPTVAKKWLRENAVWDYSLATIAYETYISMPTSLGLPLITKNVIPFIFHTSGDIDVAFARGTELKVNTYTTASANHMLKAEMWSPFGASAVKTMHAAELNLPLDLTFSKRKTKDNMKNLFEMVYHAPLKKQHVLGFHTIPFTYFVSDKNVFAEPESYKTIHNRYLTHTEHKINHEFLHYTGLPIKAVGYGYDLISLSKPLEVMFTGRNRLDIFMEPHRSSPRVFVAQIEYNSADKEWTSKKPDFEDFYSRDNKHLFKIDDMSEDEDFDRVNEFSENVRKYTAEKTNHQQLSIKLGALEGSVERKVELITDTFCDDSQKNSHCRAVAMIYRTPIPEWNEDEDWSARVILNSYYPAPLEALSRLDDKKHRELTATLSVYWGNKHHDANIIKIKMQGEQGAVLRQLIRKELERRELSAMKRFELLEKANTMNQMKFDVSYRIQSDIVKQYAKASFTYLLYNNYFRTESQRTTVQNMSKYQLYAKLTVDPEQMRYMNITIEDWENTYKVHEYELPYTVPQMSSFVERLSPISMVPKSEECRVEVSRINTFKNIIYSLPMKASDCWHLMTKDCSDKQSGPKFAVQVKHMDKNSWKKLRIIIPEAKIEAELVDERMKVTVNGRRDFNTERLEALGLVIRENVLIFENEDLYVLFDGVKLTTKLAAIYKYRQCGLCSAEMEDEGIVLPNKEKTTDMARYHESFLDTVSEECKIDREELNRPESYRMNIHENLWEEVDDDEMMTSRIKTIMHTFTRELSDMICFSESAVPICPRGTIPTEQTRLKARFSCWDRQNDSALNLVHKARREVIDLSVIEEEKMKTFTKTMVIPITCELN